MRYQIEQLLKNELILRDIVGNLIRREQERVSGVKTDVIRDVHDGKLHKKMIAMEKDEDYFVLSINSSTDGAPFTNSGKRSFWPYQAVLNDLSPKLCFRNLLLTGLITTTKEPDHKLMDLYVK